MEKYLPYVQEIAISLEQAMAIAEAIADSSDQYNLVGEVYAGYYKAR